MTKGLSVDDLWNNESIQVLTKTTNPDDLQEYRKTTSTTMANASYADPTENVIDFACQVRLMLRDGLPVELLSPEEKHAYIYIFGEDELKKY
jgi:hypothetical protein